MGYINKGLYPLDKNHGRLKIYIWKIEAGEYHVASETWSSLDIFQPTFSNHRSNKSMFL